MKRGSLHEGNAGGARGSEGPGGTLYMNSWLQAFISHLDQKVKYKVLM